MIMGKSYTKKKEHKHQKWKCSLKLMGHILGSWHVQSTKEGHIFCWVHERQTCLC